MRLGILSPFQLRFRRGIERYTWSLAQALAAQGVAVDLLTRQWPRAVNWGQPSPGVTVRAMRHVRYYASRAAAVYYLLQLARRRCDWVLAFFAGYGEATALTLGQRLWHQRYTVIAQYPPDLVPHRYAEMSRGGFLRRADRRIAVSEYVAEGVREASGKECHVIGNGVDADLFRPRPELRQSVREALGIGRQAPVIVTSAALEERKGVQWVLRAMPDLIGEFPDLRYLILGEGPHRPALEAEAARLQLQANVHFLGAVLNVEAYLAAADIGCLLSTGEAFGLALIEYMAAELPVVVSQHRPFDEIVQPAWGLRVDETNVAAVTAALRPLLGDQDRRQAMGTAGRARVLELHTWAAVAEQLLAVLADNEPPSPSA